jgi:hypothetical protein
MNPGQYLQLLDAFIQFASFSFLLILSAHLFNLRGLEVVALGRPLSIQNMGLVENGLQVLEEGVVDYLHFETKMETNCMENPTALHFGRVGRDFIIVVPRYLWVNMAAIELFSLF